jgi:crotonobetainyl-CoA:carnitine CoA-transferase CaiB-like acyl-CoA transferase
MSDDLLSGYRVLDLTDLNGYACGRILASFGAEVIKIEDPGGDPWRRVGHVPARIEDIFWQVNNADKQCITLDLAQSAGIDLFRRLVSETDVIVESFMPGYLTELGVDYPALAALNPGIIVTSITPFGESGPYKKLRGSELVAAGLSGILKTIGYPDRAPVKEAGDACIYHACAAAFTATMFALYERGGSGEGQHVDVSIQEAAASRNMIALMMYQFDREIRCRSGDYFSNGSTPPRKVLWQLKDGFLSRSLNGRLGGGPSSNPALAAWMQEMGVETRLDSIDWNHTIRKPISEEFAEDLEVELAKFFVSRTRAEVQKAIADKGIGGTLVQEPADILDDVHIKDRDFLCSTNLGNGVNVKYPSRFVRLAGEETAMPAPPRLPGHDNEQVYGRLLGLEQDEIEHLRDRKVI